MKKGFNVLGAGLTGKAIEFEVTAVEPNEVAGFMPTYLRGGGAPCMAKVSAP